MYVALLIIFLISNNNNDNNNNDATDAILVSLLLNLRVNIFQSQYIQNFLTLSVCLVLTSLDFSSECSPLTLKASVFYL